MRSTRGKTRATRVTKPSQTDRGISTPLHSTERDSYGDHTLPAGVATGSGSRDGNGVFATRNTNTRLKDGGISSYYRPTERGYSL